MERQVKERLESFFRVSRSVLGPELWTEVITAMPLDKGPEDFIQTLMLQKAARGLPDLLTELARLERIIEEATESEVPYEVDGLRLNPSVQLVELSWKNLISLVRPEGDGAAAEPEPGEELVVVWKDHKTAEVKAEKASREILLALKIVIERIDPREAAARGNVPLRVIDEAVALAVDKGILLAPPSKILREDASFPHREGMDESYLSAAIFTLQWHVTQACDLHCKHCYDRSNRSALRLEKALTILDDLEDFCRRKNVRGQVSFSGGNPLLYPHFTEIYRAAFDRGFMIAILGNPAPRERMEELLEIDRPVFFQVSLEGLEEHNDFIRGPGHFRRTIEFLRLLRELGIYSMVMLTLTRDNMDQVIPLSEELRGVTDLFTFNRLAMVGEGASLGLPTRREYAAFLEKYLEAAEGNPIAGLKDNLFNILRHRKGKEFFGGCAGYGCGAAFNFIALLPDGEVHACRKFPSPVGNIYEKSLIEIYDAPAAARYRSGCRACQSCVIRPVCGGCLAVAYGHGLDVFEERDPFCFLEGL